MHFVRIQKKHYPHIYYAQENFHHIGIAGLVEFDDPVRPKMICENSEEGSKWLSVRTRRSFMTQFVSSITQGIYTPHAVAVSCYNKKRKMHNHESH